MRDRFRTFDSRISFFAFADIITAVSGMLIFITLLLATDLGRPTDSASQSANSEIEQRLQKTLTQQAEVDAQNHRLQELLAAADTAPNLDKLQADIARLRSQLAEEQKKQSAITDQLTESQATTAARDKTLGLTDLKATIQRNIEETEIMARQEAKARNDMRNLEQQTLTVQAQILKLRERDGQLWLIPDKSATTKEPILVTVAGTGATIEHFDHPEQRKELDKAGATSSFKSYLQEIKAVNQYVVFLIRPSGIALFEDLVKSARDMEFEVGYDALEEDRQIHFTKPPPIDAPSPPIDKPAPSAVPKKATPDSSSGIPADKATPTTRSTNADKPLPAASETPASPPIKKSWWQRLLEWIGFK